MWEIYKYFFLSKAKFYVCFDCILKCLQWESKRANTNFFFRKEPEQEVIFLKHVERQNMEQKREEVVQRYPAPTIMTPLKNVNVNEGERAHFEAKVGPVGDPSMVVEWYYNGTIIPASKLFNILSLFSYFELFTINLMYIRW